MLILTLRDYELLVQLFIYSFLISIFFFFIFLVFRYFIYYIFLQKWKHIFNSRCENYAKKLISVNL